MTPPGVGLVVAIDGPAGAGKSTVAKRVAAALDLTYLDTGAMYRCIALKARLAGLGPDDGDRAAVIAESSKIEFHHGPTQQVLLDGEDVTAEIRTLEIGELASALSAHPVLRRVLAGIQRQMVLAGGVVLEGRDTTTVTAFDAPIRVFLTASLDARARRRFDEIKEKQPAITLEEVTQMIASRDKRDSGREASPLTIAPGVTVIDTSDLSINEVVEAIVDLTTAK